MRILITGATGVIGRRLVPVLIEDGHRVTAHGRSKQKLERLERQGAATSSFDLFDAAAVHRAVRGHDVVVNLATHIPRSSVRMFLPGAWRENDRLRRDASSILADAAVEAGCERLIQESFAPIYDDAGEKWIDEQGAVRPAPHTRTVLDAERAVEQFTAVGGEGIALRFAYFYGPDAAPVKDMIRSIRRGWAPLPGHADAYYPSISHDDASTAVRAALHAPAGVYNVADDEPMKRRALFTALANLLGADPPRLLPSWLGRFGGSLMELLSRSQRVSNAAFKEATGWAPTHASAAEGWRDLLREL